jgi:ADP-ribosylglycohydrolase
MTTRLHDRIRGCLLGGAVGDALGAGIEFSSLARIRAEHGPDGVTGYVPAYGRTAAITDDTQLTAFTVEALLRASVRADRGVVSVPLAAWYAYQRWLITQDVAPIAVLPGRAGSSWLLDEPVLHARRAPGNTCLAGLHRTGLQVPLPAACARSKGCGSVMRSAPFGLAYRHVGPDQAAGLARECSALTHGHPTAGHASAALAWMVCALTDGSPELADVVAGALDHLDAQGPDAAETAAAVRAAVALARSGPSTPEAVETLGGGWVAEEALAIGVYCALAGSDPRAALLAAVNHSGDSDSTGSICGQLLGAAYGDAVLPADWVAEVEARGVLLQLADDLHYERTRAEELHGTHVAPTHWLVRYPGY